jgi:uncharacterized protein (DUF2132 family)
VSEEQPNNPLHGITLKALLEELVERHGFDELGRRVQIRCFTHDPSIKSALKFLRRTPWARAEVEQVWLRDHRRSKRGSSLPSW